MGMPCEGCTVIARSDSSSFALCSQHNTWLGVWALSAGERSSA